MRAERLKNFIDFISNLVADKYYGEINLKVTEGKIDIVNKTDKIKLDNESYIEYKKKHN